MSNNYVDLVLIKHPASAMYTNNNVFLFEAPKFTHLEKGEKVICVTKNGEAEGEVVNSITVTTDSDEYKFAIDATGATLPLAKIKARIRLIEFEYEDEEESE